MPITVNCPTCNRALRVPDELLGKRVKCPACATVLTASAAGAIQPSAPPPRGEEVVRRKRPPEPGEEEKEAPRPARKRPEPAEEEDYDEEEPEEEEEELPRRRRRLLGSRQRARDAVAGPAIALIILGGTYIFVSIVHLVLILIGAAWVNVVVAEGQQQQPADTAFERGRRLGQAMAIPIDIVGMCLGGIIISGAVQMKGVKSYGYALTGIISAMLPCHCCFLLGIGFGIWALVVINRPEIKSSFG